ncbi:MAG TPA: helix-turn-helix domain-containing protein [Candidatus Saccharimonadales bacterium]|jgi:DNA-binding HxlR family transcriptional regulator
MTTAPTSPTNHAATPLEPRIGCIAGAMDIIGNKWTALILRDLAGGPKRFGELEKSLAGTKATTCISPRTLSQRLDDLESNGIITRRILTDMPPRCEYSLTSKGHDLIPILKQMAVWGAKYYDADTPC